jgi:glycine dehydrogenase
MQPDQSVGRFARRHIGPSPEERAAMLEAVGAASLDALVDEAIPPSIRLSSPLHLPPAESESDYLNRIARLAAGTRPYRSYIGLGFHDTITPSVIRRLVLENPAWYTPYTPYQSEIAQGRLEALLNFQTMVTELTGMEVANASLLDEATAAAEAMALMYRVRKPDDVERRRVCLVSDGCLPQSIAVLRSRAEPLGLDLRVEPVDDLRCDDTTCGVLLQYPDIDGRLVDLAPVIARAHAAGALAAVGADPLALALVRPPGEMGADVVFGTSQRFGVPMGYGGPHAAFLATRSAFVRQMPGRLIGVTVDVEGRRAYRLALATREQHIRREKATSNICTSQALPANVAAFFAIYHGAEGVRAIAERVHALACTLETSLADLGVAQLNDTYFDTVRFDVGGRSESVLRGAVRAGMNFGAGRNETVSISLNETTTPDDVRDIVAVFADALGRDVPAAGPHTRSSSGAPASPIPPSLRRSGPCLAHPVFSAYRSETRMMRYLRSLERKDVGLDMSMIPLGSCTMKLNPATAMLPVTWESFGRAHPFVPADQAPGYRRVIEELKEALCEITGFSAVSLQPNSGAQGEFTGLMVIRAYHRDRGQPERRVALIPASAHGTNPASAVMAGMEVVVVATAPDGSVDLEDLERKASAHRTRLACLMITYPSTHGVFEDRIREVCDTVHRYGGQVYLDGANMNAQVGLTSPATIGADCCHLNLHKTFAIPHGGGGPGMGPVCVAPHLAPFLPRHPHADTGGEKGITAVGAAPWGSASILLIAHAYIRMLGGDGLIEATRHAILNANYLKARLERHYPVLYAGRNNRVAHELIFDLRAFRAAGIDEMDVAKRLIDYGFHAPTVSFPVAGTLMVEPTESEDKAELDRFCDAMIAIRAEIESVVTGAADRVDNVLKNAPHTADAVAATVWTHRYAREEAAFPLPGSHEHKFWPPVARVDNAYGDRHLVCSCPPIEG